MTNRPNLKFIENNSLIDDIHKALLIKYQGGFEGGYAIIVDPIENIWNDLVNNTYDCHSFAMHFLSLLGIPTYQHPKVEKPNLSDCDYSSHRFQTLLEDRLNQARSTPEGKIYVEKIKRLTEEVYHNSIRYPISKYDINEVGIKQAKEDSNRICSQVILTLTKSESSRFLLISNNQPGDDFSDNHSAIFIGPTLTYDNLWIIEEKGIGQEPHFDKLTNVICEYSLTQKGYQNLSINILKKPIQSLLE